MPINVNDPEYTNAEKKYEEAKTLEEKLMALNKMISHAPKHKGGENLRQQLTTRRKKLEEQIEKREKKSRLTKKGIKKEEMQAVIIGKTNSGKSTLLKLLTNAAPTISPVEFTTNESTVGIMNYKDTQVQLIEIPPIDGENFDKSLAHTADTVIFLLKNEKEIEELRKKAYMITGKEIIALNKSELLSKEEKRKITARLSSKKQNFILISCFTKEGIDELKEKIFSSFEVLRIYTKEPGKEKTKKPVIMKPGSTVSDVAEKILKGFSNKIKRTKIWGPSSKFPGQIVGLNHKLKDLDTVEFTTK